MSHTFLTVAVPLDTGNTDDVNARLDSYGNPFRRDLRNLFRGSSVHFMSVNVLPADRDNSHGAFLVIETSQDGDKQAAIDDIATRLRDVLRDILSVAGHEVEEAKLAEFLTEHSHDSGLGLFSTPGLNHAGTPGMTATRIRREWDFARRVRELAGEGSVSGSPLEILNQVHERMAGLAEFADMMRVEDVPFARSNAAVSVPIVKMVINGLKTFTWPYLIVFAIALFWAVGFAGRAGGAWFAVAMGGLTLLGGVLILAAAVGLIYARLRARERTDSAADLTPDYDVLSQVMARENNGSINHLYGVSKMKPGRLRRLTLRFAFWFIAQMATHVFRPGYLGNIGTIHFARWIMVPGTDKLLFFSNYGGSWESYLEDFITKASGGLTAVWSNTEEYPKTENLFLKGATDGDRFKRWARRQQLPTRLWYSAYPNTTTDRIRGNAFIRRGLLTAKTESQAREWLSLIGSRRMPAHALETDEIQTILFGGLRKLNEAACLLIKLPDDSSKAKAWLRELQGHVRYGDRPPDRKAILFAVTSSGLSKLGLTEEQMSAFPAAFRQGMNEPTRAKHVLKDTGDDKPEDWWWGNEAAAVDAAIIVYAQTSQFEKAVGEQVTLFTGHGCELVHQITAKASPAGGGVEREAFGFADGISQPILKGTRRSIARADAIHTVEPGEFILGYPDNRNFMPTSPLLPAKDDPNNILPVHKPLAEADDWPDFAADEVDRPRNIGRNGSYLVVRQLEQDVNAFHDFSKKAADEIKNRQGIPPGATRKQLQEWIEAKMVGRWKNGTSLVRYPFEEGDGKPDNEFLFGQEDPSGFRCPFGAHIRRANPRDSLHPQDSEAELSISNKHRILRVGRQYDVSGAGHEEARDPGLLFMCLNGDLERQFEFVQQTWCMERMFHGMDGEVDSILGRGRKGGRLTIPTPQGPISITGLQDFVRTRGGAYFFMPGRSTIKYLAET